MPENKHSPNPNIIDKTTIEEKRKKQPEIITSLIKLAKHKSIVHNGQIISDPLTLFYESDFPQGVSISDLKKQARAKLRDFHSDTMDRNLLEKWKIKSTDGTSSQPALAVAEDLARKMTETFSAFSNMREEEWQAFLNNREQLLSRAQQQKYTEKYQRDIPQTSINKVTMPTEFDAEQANNQARITNLRVEIDNAQVEMNMNKGDNRKLRLLRKKITRLSKDLQTLQSGKQPVQRKTRKPPSFDNATPDAGSGENYLKRKHEDEEIDDADDYF